ncbi:MAG TPA: sigma-54 dependent transcriptional regulator [Longimicrobiales bacterium]|nr:sigma-54 dependent transcriptional regulator [Longimicrobiales bacterium]
MATILIVDDDDRVLTSLARTLRGDGYSVHTARSAEQALGDLTRVRPDLVLTDVRMTGMDGIELLRLLRERVPALPVVLMTAYGDLPTVTSAMRAGAADFLMKPLELAQLRAVLRGTFEDVQARAAAVPQAVEAVTGGSALVGRDARMVEIFKLIAQVADSRATVIVRGESGTGKELIARALHDSSRFSAEPFVAINCTAVPATLLESELFGHVRGAFTGATSDRRGRFALAGTGTVFLDEIGDTTLDFQSKLLRVLQEREFFPVGAERPEQTQARVIAATHRDLEALVERGTFRQDLYYRLRVVEIVLPPLRERTADLTLLAEHLIDKASRALGRRAPTLAPAALDALLAYAWPGNVRELENTLTRAVVLAPGDVIRREHLALEPATTRPQSAEPTTRLEHAIREHIVMVLESAGGRKARAARMLGISRPRLDRLIDKYGIKLHQGAED